MTINKPHRCTKLEVWFPRYNDQYVSGEKVALLAQYKVDQATPIIIVEFTKAKHLMGQRFCIRKDTAQRCDIDTNGKISCYAVPMSMFDSWETGAEVREIALNIWKDK